jgi:hypothetical protein
VIVSARDDKLAEQLRSELVAAGYEPIVVQEPSAKNPGSVYGVIADQYGAAGVLSIVQGATAVQVWVWTQAGHRLVAVDLVFEPGQTDTHRSLMAVRAVEALRAATLNAPADHSRRLPTESQSPTRGVPGQATPDAARWTVSAGPSLVLNPGGIGALWNASIEVGYFIAAPLHVQAMASFPLSSTTVSSSRGASDVRSTILIASAVASSGGNLRGYAGLGAGLVRMTGEGSAAPPRVGMYDATHAALASATVGARARLASNVDVWGEAIAAVSFPKVEVMHGPQTAGFAGRPLIAATLGLSLSW